MLTPFALGPWAAAVVVAAVADARTSQVPTGLVRAAAAATVLGTGLAAWGTQRWLALASAVMAAGVAGLAFGLVALLRPASLGMGDARMAALVALGVGTVSFGAGIAATAVASFAAAGYGCALRRRGRGRAPAVALGPFMAATAVPIAGLAAVLRQGALWGRGAV